MNRREFMKLAGAVGAGLLGVGDVKAAAPVVGKRVHRYILDDPIYDEPDEAWKKRWEGMTWYTYPYPERDPLLNAVMKVMKKP